MFFFKNFSATVSFQNKGKNMNFLPHQVLAISSANNEA
jgi:hypothetical protein